MEGAHLVETHISVLLLTGARAYKLKKPVQLDFLDWRRREDRERMCHREVDLNRRLAPDVYLGVLDVVRDGVPCDHVVEMRRMPDDRRLSALVAAGADLTQGIYDLASTLADFHASAHRSPSISRAVEVASLRRRWDDNLAGIGAHVPAVFDQTEVGEVARLAHAYLAGRDDLFEARIAGGCAVDGHGDLLADDTYLLPDGPRVLDCLEFRDDLRCVDVLDDVSSLVMDLERLGAAEQARQLVRAYDAHGAPPYPASLLHHYVAYRAGVRALVGGVRAGQRSGEGAVGARELLRRCLDHLREGRVRFVLVGGLPGTGKSTLAAAIGDAFGWRVVRSDIVRKELAGIDPLEDASAPVDTGLYDAGATEVTYGEVLRRASASARMGESVVLDASWSDGALRQRARRCAEACHAEVLELRCEAPAAVAADRIRRRSGTDASDATVDVADAMAHLFAPWDEAHTIDTAAAVEEALRGAKEVLS